MKNEYKNRVLNFLKKFYSPINSLEDQRRIALHVILSLIGITFLIIFGAIAYAQQNYWLSIADITIAFILALNLFHLHRKKDYHFNIVLGVSFVSLLYVYLYVSGGTGKTAFVWYYTYPLITCFLLGSFSGGIASALMTLPVLVVALLGSKNNSIADYSLNFEIRFIAAYVVVVFFAYIYERQGEKNRWDLNEINASLENMVSERTAELTQKNAQLTKEVKERNRAEKAAHHSQESLTTIMDSIEATIYVVDKESCKILFMNKYLKDIVGYDLIGKICWKDLCHLTEPCINCMSQKTMDSEGNTAIPAIWEGNNPVTNEWSINIDRSIKWISGRYAHLHIATNISHLKKLEDERRSMELRLQRAQKMEAIGTLAGGVAHDLNNILSGIVSYPEMLLWKLENKSPLRKPILAIQNAGQKAADIVQDLLTLARRGVNTKEVISINETIIEYLKSPEYAALMSYHPNISVKTDLDQSLLNITGSPTHIRQTVMNLVSNAAEAQSDGGEIRISTYNYNFDLPQKGYDLIREGDFVAVEVSDKGCGISKEDLERIFEPFYTKKIMGRSGTGLGMAVVWGTVQDHFGHIEVDSKENEGTTFYLYFRVTREKLKKETGALPASEYMGIGQVILIVDDVQEQREIATAILEILNYKPVAVSSGEKAIEYLQTQEADLILLDMIMDPGIDGLETYQKILEIKPNQKAIIASGYAETDRVKQIQKMGAGTYIKKPFTIETIGCAIKDELEKSF